MVRFLQGKAISSESFNCADYFVAQLFCDKFRGRLKPDMLILMGAMKQLTGVASLFGFSEYSVIRKLLPDIDAKPDPWDVQ